MHETRGCYAGPVAVERRVGGEAEAREGGGDDVVWERFWGVFLAEEGHYWEEFEEGAWPAVEEGDGNCGGVLGEEGCEVD